MPSQNDDLGAVQSKLWGSWCPMRLQKCVRAECRPVKPFNTMYAEGEGRTWGDFPFRLLFLR